MDALTEFWRDPALPYAESRRACHSKACYKPHSHPTFSIGAVDAGASRFTGAGVGPLPLAPGAVVFVPAHCVHACNPLPDRAWSYQMLHLDADWLHALLSECGGHGAAAFISGDAALYRHFSQLNALLFSAAGPEEKECALIEFLGDWLGGGPARAWPPPAKPAPSAALRELIAGLAREEGAPHALDALSRRCGISRYHLIRVFRQATGMTPHAFQLNARVNRARHWLRSGADMAAIAQRLGFADQAHFQRVFKAHAGVTPGRYRG